MTASVNTLHETNALVACGSRDDAINRFNSSVNFTGTAISLKINRAKRNVNLTVIEAIEFGRFKFTRATIINVEI